MIKTAIIGASGYTGFELMKLLLAHPEADLLAVTSRQYKGQAVADIFPSLTGITDLVFSDTDDLASSGTNEAELVFTALPHGTSQAVVAKCVTGGQKVIDLSADFRLKEADAYKTWYGADHQAPALLKTAVYGLPELHRDDIRGATLVANPGCYPTCAILGLAPLLKAGLIKGESVIIDAKSGVSGAGRGLNLATSYVEVNEGFKAYNVGVHRHTPEIEQELALCAAGATTVTFTPRLLPLNRGMVATIYATLTGEYATESLLAAFSDFYRDEPFVRVMDADTYPNLNQVRNSNYCDIGCKADSRTGRVVVVSALDNLIKGASGQAVQNMNLIYDLPETTGLTRSPDPI